MAKEKKSPASQAIEMSLEEARAYRAALHKPTVKPLNEAQKREAFRIFWAGNKSKYGTSKQLEKVLWLHLKSVGMDHPEKFHDGIFNFGLKKVK